MHGVQEYELSLKFLDEALKLNEKYHGVESQRVALRSVHNKLNLSDKALLPLYKLFI